MLTCVNEKRAATVAAAAAGRWREARQGRAYTRLSRGRYAAASYVRYVSATRRWAFPRRCRAGATCRGARRYRSFRQLRTARIRSFWSETKVVSATPSIGAAIQVVYAHRSFCLCLQVVSASIGESHWPPQGGARQNRNCESIGTILSLSWKLLRAFDSRVSGVRVLRVRRQASCGSRWS
jgi:hypothetical protein